MKAKSLITDSTKYDDDVNRNLEIIKKNGGIDIEIDNKIVDYNHNIEVDGIVKLFVVIKYKQQKTKKEILNESTIKDK